MFRRNLRHLQGALCQYLKLTEISQITKVIHVIPHDRITAFDITGFHNLF